MRTAVVFFLGFVIGGLVFPMVVAVVAGVLDRRDRRARA